MKVFKWLNEHFEESILIILLAIISTVMMTQILARTFFRSMPWPEEFARYCYIWTVFLSLGYTIRKQNMLRVTIVMDMLPHKLRKTLEIITNTIMLGLFLILFRYAIVYTGIIRTTGQMSPAMQIPMWMMYLSTVLGFGLASIRMIQEIIINFRNFNKKAESTREVVLKEAAEEVQATGVKLKGNAEISGGDA
ncbi:MAG: TRAP transporter small permease [Bacillota bacterium]|nr:TRAP transporter small permease [Bacillota bacterium]MDW7678111.1 TRAP transporter small permease [Bacillota bacterium]